MTKSNSSATISTSNLYEHPWYSQLKLLENTTTYEYPLRQKQQSEAIGQKFTDKSRKGDIAEQYVAFMATWKGAEVFQNINCTGKVDLILKINDCLYEIDVKLARLNTAKDGWYGATASVQPPVIPVIVIPDGDVFNWKIKWIRNRYPKELEHFWNKPTNGHQI